MTHIVYLARNTINGGEYVGLSNRALAVRRKEHIYDAARPRIGGCRAFHAALRKYGVDAFEWVVIAEFESRADAVAREIAEIAGRKTRYNITAGGPGIIAERTPEWRKNISAGLKGRKLSPQAIANIRAARPPGLFNKAVVCLEDADFFPSIKAAAKAYKIKAAKITAALHNHKGRVTAAGRHFLLSGKPLSKEDCAERLSQMLRAQEQRRDAAPNVRRKAIVCVTTGVAYPSASAAAKALTLSPMTISVICNHGGQTNAGLRFRFADAEEVVRPPRDPADIEAGRRSRVEKLKARRHPPETIERMRKTAKKRGVAAITRSAQIASQQKPIVCNETGTVFPDAAQAALAHGLKRSHIYDLLFKGRVSRTAFVSFRHALPHERGMMNAREAA